MKFKHVIGLDIGTNSLGWCLLKEFEDGKIDIVKTGVHIFPIGTIVDEVSNKEKTRNEQRRAYRGASRMRYRFKLRREKLKNALKDLGMLPKYELYHKAKGKGQSFELYKLRADAINPDIAIQPEEIGRIFMLLNKYRGFKSNAKNPQENTKETGEVKAGYEKLQQLIDKSGAQTIGEYFFKMHEKAKKLYDENKWHNYNEPIDERAYNNGDENDIILFNSNGIRRHNGRYTLRDMYLKEFDMIWAAQKQHYPDKLTGSKAEYDEIMKKPYKECIAALKAFKKTNYWHLREYCIYFQRPLKSQKRFVSTCGLERGEYNLQEVEVSENEITKIKQKRVWKKKAKKVCPKSHPLFQEFRIWQKLHQIKYSAPELDIFRRSLEKDWLPVLAEALMENAEVYFKGTKKVKAEGKPYFGQILLSKGLIDNEAIYEFYIDKNDEDVASDDKNETKIAGNVTYAGFKEALGNEKFNELKNSTVTLKQHLDKDTIVEVEEDKLTQLWNTIYQAKDGLFKELDWLLRVLTEPTKWNLTKEQAEKLLAKGLVSDYGSYSSKVLKAILPFMRAGMNEHDAKLATNRGYVNEDGTVGRKVQQREKISQLSYQELRNPVVERALSKTIKLVNAILEKYGNEIDRETFEIRIESTRQLRKPREERETERRKNADKDKLREQYAKYLTDNKEKLGFKYDIYKNSPLVNKYELWLQMNMNEEDEFFIQEFKNFSKTTKEQDRLKHRLWLECGRRCPYTGAVINLTDCFSPEVEIEHIIPLSRSLDDSFTNKTLTYRSTNAEKGSLTPLEYLSKKGDKALHAFKERMKSKHHRFSDSKKELFLAEKVSEGFSSNQISNTSYIAKYTRTKMQEVCKNVQFTNGSATAELRNYDWSLSNLLDKIRYEEETGINMDEIYTNYYRIKKDYQQWIERKLNSTDIKIDWKNLSDDKNLQTYTKQTQNDLLYWFGEIEKFNQFRDKSGKKDRSDHRHHAIDAVVTACCTPSIIKELSTNNAIREQKNLRDRAKIEKNFDYQQVKESIAAILVSHSEKQTLIKKRKNRIKTKNGVIEHVTYAPQGKLHKDSFYGKRNGATVRRVELFNDERQSKVLFEEAGELDYKVKGQVKWHYIPDEELYLITKARLEKLGKNAFIKNEMEKNPFYRTSPKTPEKLTSKKRGKPLPVVKSIRQRYNTDRTLIQLPATERERNTKKIIFENRWVENDSNALMVLYNKTNVDKKGNYKKSDRDFEILSFYKAVSQKNPKSSFYQYGGKLYYDEKDETGLNKECKWVKQGDIVALYLDEKEKENFGWENVSQLKERLFIVKGLSSSIVVTNGKEYEFGYISLLKTKTSKAQSYPSAKEISECVALNSFKISHLKFNAIKVRINILGEIVAKGQECFR
ncbi:MAG: hypothetical protein KIS94_13215 [Chitinophagales bacterium]|nr:hypothetical protein [Chitinophagales bacterium]